MGSDPNGGHRGGPVEERLNVFALVTYIPDPLGGFLDRLRRELVPGCDPRAHVSVLPPRPLGVDWKEASDHARALAESWPSFEIELDGVERFPVTDVVYVGLSQGAADLHRLHAAMNVGALAFEEPYSYHPHVTLAQEIRPEDAAAVQEAAHRRWSEFPGPRRFRINRTVLVQNTLDNRWIDVAEYSLGVAAPR